jgi:chemotaxis protein CheD
MSERAASLSLTDTKSDADALRRYFNPVDGCWHVQLSQGDCYVTEDPREILTTILGSCVAACMRDPIAGLGGMNHFLLPEGSDNDRYASRYGVNAMELLINGILRKGGSRQRLQAKLFGGANVIAALSDVGSRNVVFAESFLAEEGIQIIGGDVGGPSPRRIRYSPVRGTALQSKLPAASATLLQQEMLAARRKPAQATESAGDVELF